MVGGRLRQEGVCPYGRSPGSGQVGLSGPTLWSLSGVTWASPAPAQETLDAPFGQCFQLAETAQLGPILGAARALLTQLSPEHGHFWGKARACGRHKTLFIVTVGLNLTQVAEEQLPTLQHLLGCWSSGSAGDWWSWLLSLCSSPNFGLGKKFPQVLLPRVLRKCYLFPHLSLCWAA